MNVSALPLWAAIAIFAASAATVWLAGWRISQCADVIRERLNISEALVGLVLLGSVTSLPELATAVSGAAQGNPDLVVNNILGAIALQLVILAVADAASGREALSSIVASPTVLLQGTLAIVLLSLVVAGTTVGDRPLIGIGVWSWLILLTYIGSLWLVSSTRSRDSWAASTTRDRERSNAPLVAAQRLVDQHVEEVALAPTLRRTAALAAVILVAGYFLATTGETIAQASGLGSSFFGAVFLAFSTALPELSTVLSAVRLGRHEMAVSDVFGTNLINVAIVFVIDAVYAGEPVLTVVGRFSTFGALLGITVTALFLAGLIERRDRAFLRMGVDSIAVLLVYCSGLVVLHSLR